MTASRKTIYNLIAGKSPTSEVTSTATTISANHNKLLRQFGPTANPVEYNSTTGAVIVAYPDNIGRRFTSGATVIPLRGHLSAVEAQCFLEVGGFGHPSERK